MAQETYHIRPIVIPFVLILLTNIAGWLHLVPVFVQLLINSSSCVYIGCIMSTKITKNPAGQLQSYSKSLGEDEEVIGMKEAKKFPIVASAFLFGFYILYKYVSKDLVNALISIQFSLATIISTSGLIFELFNFSAESKIVLLKVKVHRWIEKILEIKDFEVSKASLICTLICSIPVILFYVTKHWALNNIYGVLFSVMALKSINLSSFKVGFFLLWALFFYDIFWVYGTDVMVTVAKNLDIPIKLMFPYLSAEGEEKFSMVGLGDIVIPGIFISLCLKFDVDKYFQSQKPALLSEITLSYFNLSFIGYALGIVETFLAMYIFDHAQPALLFLVPMCTLTVLLRSFIKKQFNEAQHYTTGLVKEESPEEKDTKKEGESSEETKKED